MSYLKWIDDSVLKTEVKHLLTTATVAQEQASQKFCQNIIDPFAALFEIAGFRIDYSTWVKSESTRQAQKTLQNHIGSFHQNILGATKGWTNLGVGRVVDLESVESKIIAEVKNKYNTISGGKLADLYYSLDKLVSSKSSIYKGYTAYYVAVIPKNGKRYNMPFTPSDKDKGAKCPINECIRETDGASFYELVTGCQNALEDLFRVLPLVIHDCSEGEFQVKDSEKLYDFFNIAYQS